MKATESHHKKIETLTFASVYPHYLTKVTKKGRTEDELMTIIKWLTGYDENEINRLKEETVTFKLFFENAHLNPDAIKIKGSICGYKIEEIDNELTKKVRYLDKIVDELAQGKSLQKIMRKEKV